MMYDDLTPEALIKKGEQLEKSGRLTQALEVWQAAAELEPDPETLCGSFKSLFLPQRSTKSSNRSCRFLSFLCFFVAKTLLMNRA